MSSVYLNTSTSPPANRWQALSMSESGRCGATVDQPRGAALRGTTKNFLSLQREIIYYFGRLDLISLRSLCTKFQAIRSPAAPSR